MAPPPPGSSRSRGWTAPCARSPPPCSAPRPAARPSRATSKNLPCRTSATLRVAERAQGVVDGLALGVEHRLLERHVDARLGHALSSPLPRRRLGASAVASRTIAARRGAGSRCPPRARPPVDLLVHVARGPAPARRSRAPRRPGGSAPRSRRSASTSTTGSRSGSTCGEARAASRRICLHLRPGRCRSATPTSTRVVSGAVGRLRFTTPLLDRAGCWAPPGSSRPRS